MATVREVINYFQGLDPDEEVLWQAFTREHIEDVSGALSDEVWELVVLLYDKNPASDEDFGIGELIDIATERVGE